MLTWKTEVGTFPFSPFLGHIHSIWRFSYLPPSNIHMYIHNLYVYYVPMAVTLGVLVSLIKRMQQTMTMTSKIHMCILCTNDSNTRSISITDQRMQQTMTWCWVGVSLCVQTGVQCQGWVRDQWSPECHHHCLFVTFLSFWALMAPLIGRE